MALLDPFRTLVRDNELKIATATPRNDVIRGYIFVTRNYVDSVLSCRGFSRSV